MPGGGNERTLSSTAAQSSGIGGGEIAGEPWSAGSERARCGQEACGVADGEAEKPLLTAQKTEARSSTACRPLARSSYSGRGDTGNTTIGHYSLAGINRGIDCAPHAAQLQASKKAPGDSEVAEPRWVWH